MTRTISTRSSASPEEQRRSPRIRPTALNATLPALGVVARVRDVSAGGFALWLDAAIPANIEHVVEIKLNNVLGVVLRGAVAHSRGRRPGERGFASLAGFSVGEEDAREALGLLL